MIGSSLLAPRAQQGFASYPPDHDYWYTPRGQPTTAGIEVSEESAMRCATVFACVNKRAKTIATLPVHVMRSLPGDRREKVPDHPVQRMFTVRFNEEALAVPTRWAMMVNKLLWGNAYFEVIYNQVTGEPMAMALLYSRFMTVERDPQTNRLVYNYREPGQVPVPLPPERVLHIPGLSYNGLVGLSVIGFARETIGLGIGTAQYRAAFLGNGAAPGIVIERPPETTAPLSPEAGERLVNSFDEKHKGTGNAFRTVLLRDGMTLKTIGMPMEDAQFLELARLDREDIRGIFDVQPPKIQDYTNATYSNVEQANIDWVVDSLTPDCVQIESTVGATFFDGTDLYLKHNLDGLKRGDFKSRHEGYRIGREIGMYDTDDLRRMEDLAALPDKKGKHDFWRPKNMGIVGEEEEQSKTLDEIKDGMKASSRTLAEIKEREDLLRADHIKDREIAQKDRQAQANALDSLEASVVNTHDTFSGLLGPIYGDVKQLREDTEACHKAIHEGISHTDTILAEADQRDTRHREMSQALVAQVCILAKTVDQVAATLSAKQRHGLMGLLLDPAKRAVAKETKAIGNAWKRYSKSEQPEAFLAWLDKFYTEHQDYLCEVFRATVTHAMSLQSANRFTAETLLQELAAMEVDVSRAALREAMQKPDAPDEVLDELNRWKQEKAATMAGWLLERICGAEGEGVTE